MHLKLNQGQIKLAGGLGTAVGVTRHETVKGLD